MHKIFIIEDHPLVLEGLVSYFAGSGRWKVAGTASSLAGAKEQLANTKVQVLLLDIQLPDGWGLDVITWLNEQSHAKSALTAVYSGFTDYAHVKAALSLGVKAYVSKLRSVKELEEALLNALDGTLYIDKEAQSKMDLQDDKLKVLSKREMEILTLAKSGLSSKEIAVKLEISHRTVDNILSCIYYKTGIKSRRELERL